MLLPIKIWYIFAFIIAIKLLVGWNEKVITPPPLEDEPKLHGNFLHITDFHPDPHYITNVTAKSRCHHKHVQTTGRPEFMLKGISGPWGAPATICDSPLELVDATFDWLENNWKDKLDFIIWTGDNSRHDNDENIPRTPQEIFRLNRMISEKFLKRFANTNKKNAPHFIPIVPSIGNNDIYPNRIVAPGPNELLSVLHEIWSPFIPKGQHETFLNGGYYYTEVIPGKLIVVSLNTLYFYSSNTAVNGCKTKGQPGTNQMEWLNGVLENARKLGMKVYLTGHIAPRAKQYWISCYKKYGRLSLEYQDIILGHYYGHSNMDHFFFISSKSISKGHPNDDDGVLSMDDDDVYDDDDEYEEEEEEIFDKEQTSLEAKGNDRVETKIKDINQYMKNLLNNYRTLPTLPDDDVAKDYVAIHINPSIIPTFFPALRIFKYNTNETINENTITEQPQAPKNSFLTPLGYTQYFINLTHANLYPNVTPEFTVEYTTWDDYKMKDLTVLSWAKLARKIVNVVNNGFDEINGFNGMLWEKFQEHLYVGTRSLIVQKRNSLRNCINSECAVKGPEDYIASELNF